MTILSLCSRVLAATLGFALVMPSHAQVLPSGTSPSIQMPLQAQLPNQIPVEGAQAAQLWMNGISYEPADYFSEPLVHADLSIGYRFNYKFNFNLKARSLNGKAKTVPDGWYLFTLALLNKDTSRLYNRAQPSDLYDRFITAASPSLVLVTGGEFSVPVSLRFEGITPTALSSLLLVELLPLKETCEYSTSNGKISRPCVSVKPDGRADAANSDVTQLLPGYRPYLAQLSFIPFKNKDSGRPLIDDESSPLGTQTLAKFVVEARKRQNMKRLANAAPKLSAQQYAREHRLHYVDLDDAELNSSDYLRNASAKEIISEFLNQTGIQGVTAKESQRKVLSAFCDLLVRKNKQYNETPVYPSMMTTSLYDTIRMCGTSKSTLLQLSRNIHVGKVDTTRPVQISMNPQLNYTIMNNFFMSRMSSRESSTSFTEKPLALVRFIEAIGVGIPFDVSHSISVSNAQTKAEMVITTMNEVMDFNPLGLVFTGVNTQSCLQVTVRPSGATPFYDSTPGAKNGLYICASKKSRSQIEELYAHVFTHAHDSSIVRAFEPGTQTLNVALRGDRDLSAFFYQIRGAIKPVFGPDVFPNALPAMAEKLFAKPMAYPGIISSPINFERDWKMSLAQGALMQYKETFMGEQASR